MLVWFDGDDCPSFSIEMCQLTISCLFYFFAYRYALSGMSLNQLTGLKFKMDIDLGPNVTLTEELPGEIILKDFLHLDPETHHAGTYVLILFFYACVITFLGYFVIRRNLGQKTG